MDVRLPIPKHWQDFESICHRLWSEIWNDLNAQKNGRQGQAQHGVDVFGVPLYSSDTHGVQCKDKDARLGSVLTKKELAAESTSAIEFQPQLRHFTMATTASRDQMLQEFARELTQSEKFPFRIDIWSWDDIESEIAYRPSLLQYFYSDFSIAAPSVPEITLNRFSSRDHFHAFFTRPQVLDKLSGKFQEYFKPVVYELMDNAYKYGKASQFQIKIDGTEIIIKDDGNQFNPLTDLDSSKVTSHSHIGSFVFEVFLKTFGGSILVSYERLDNFNCLKFKFGNHVIDFDDDHIEINVDLRQAYGRDNAKKLTHSLPLNKKELLLNVSNLHNLSVFAEFTQEVLNHITKDQKLVLSLPRHRYLAEFESWFSDERLVIKMR